MSASQIVIEKAVRDAGLPYKIARIYIAARVPAEVAVKVLAKFRKDMSSRHLHKRNRRRDAYSLLIDAIGFKATSTFFAQHAPAPVSPRQLAQARPALPAAKAAAPRRATSAEMWDQVISELNEETKRSGPPIGGARVLPNGQ
jgi:hypothetical protein